MIDIIDLEELSKEKENENYRFRKYLKIHADEEELDRQFKRLHQKYFKIYDTEIPVAIKTAEATIAGKSIFAFDKNSKVANAYKDLAKEVMQDDREKKRNAPSFYR